MIIIPIAARKISLRAAFKVADRPFIIIYINSGKKCRSFFKKIFSKILKKHVKTLYNVKAIKYNVVT